MLTRSRELYNNLTNSKAYAESGAMDNTKINKNAFTPNNLKAIILGADGVVAMYFTTNDTNRKLVSYLPFTKLPRNEEELAQSLKSEKGMIDALCDGLKFSNIEEIFLCTDGFNPMDAEKEYARLMAFANNKLLIQKSFKRLRGIKLINKSLTPDYASSLTNEGTIASQLKKTNLPTQSVAMFEPETNELGLLKNIELDNGEYKLDAKYNPDADAKERDSQDCRLSRYFYMLEQKARKAKEDVAKAQAEAEKEKVDEVAINLNLSKIMTVFRDLYKSCFGLKKPVGLLVPEGILYSREGKTQVLASKEYAKIYDLAVSSSSFGVQPLDQLQGIDVHDLYKVPLNGTYFPLFHLAVMQGRTPDWVFKSWDLPEKRKKNDKEIETTLEKEITNLINAKLIETYKKGDDLSGITNKLCTSFVVTELAQAGDKSLLMMKLKLNVGNAKFSLDNFCSTFVSAGDTYLAGGAKITQRAQKKTGVSQVSLCLNEDLYQMMPLFAYDAVEHKKARGQKVSIKNCIIGQTVDDEIMTIDLTKNDSKIINILAGPRAGKGVLTLGLLGTILSDGCPLIYMDAKPDMSNVLNDLANSKGIRVAAWDLNTPPMEYLKDNPIMQSLSDAKLQAIQALGQNAPSELSESTSNSTWGLLAYLKVMQLMMVSASLQKSGKIVTSGAGQAFFVLDELLRVYSEVRLFVSVLNNIIKNKDTDKTLLNWSNKVNDWMKKLAVEIEGTIVAEMPNAYTSILCLYQKASTWGYSGEAAKFPQSIFTPITSASNSTKIVGGGNATAEGYESLYALQQQDRNLATKVTQYRHFGMFTGSRLNDASNCTVFKPYLVLNSSDMNSQYVRDMEANIGPKAFEDLLAKGGGEVPPGVGFEGFMNSIGEEGIQNLSRGYEYLTEILQVSGLAKKYSSIEEYLYDADINSFYPKGVLIAGRAGEVVEDSKPKVDVASSGSWNLDGESGNEEEVNLFDSGSTSNTENPFRTQSQQTTHSAQSQTGPKPQSQQAQQGQTWQNQQQAAKSQPQQTRNLMNSNRAKTYQTAYTNQLDIPEGKNPFANYRGDGAVSTLNQLKEMTKLILQDISSVFGGLDRVAIFRVTEDGILIINDTAYQPQFDTAFLETLPFAIQGKVSTGCVAELFDLSKVYQFKNLQSLVIDSQTLAQGRARREFGLRPRERYNVLFKVFRQLQYINAGGVEYRGFNPDEVINDTRDTLKGYTFGERMKNLFAGSKQTQPQTYTSSPRMEAFWNSKPVRLTTNALGWTLGTKAVLMSAAIFGPWSLLFGALMLAGKYSDYKEKHPDKPKPRQNQRVGQSQGRYRDDYYDDYDDYDRQGRRQNSSNYKNNQNGQSRSNNNRNNR